MQVVLLLIVLSPSGMRVFDSQVPFLPKKSLLQHQQACESGQEGLRNVFRENWVRTFQWFYPVMKVELWDVTLQFTVLNCSVLGNRLKCTFPTCWLYLECQNIKEDSTASCIFQRHSETSDLLLGCREHRWSLCVISQVNLLLHSAATRPSRAFVETQGGRCRSFCKHRVKR